MPPMEELGRGKALADSVTRIRTGRLRQTTAGAIIAQTYAAIESIRNRRLGYGSGMSWSARS